jgi:signal transduction histidine kinase
MTLRLVALMSVVLLLSLGAFGLLMAYYQDQVMEEVTRTAAVVGREALRTLEQGRLEELPLGEAAAHSQVIFWSGICESEDPQDCVKKIREYRLTHHAGELPLELTEGLERIVGSDESGLRRIRREVVTSGKDKTVTVVCESSGEESAAGEQDCVADGSPELRASVFISVDDVHAESDPAEGLVLKIPTFATEKAPDAAANEFEFETHDTRVHEAQLISRLGEIHLPIPVEEDYRELFSSIRKRSMFLFFGVFVVGTVLSAGLATRFTRPIRRLDGGIRRLSEGDLDVEVATHGEDEIARLGRAFNDMTRKLRANRERSRQLVRKEKLSALGRLAAGVAHDVRNPLHSIGLTLQHLTETGRPESGQRAEEFDRALGVIRGEIRRLDRLVGNFLRFAGSERGERHAVDLKELLRETVRLVGKEAERRRIGVDLEIDEAAPVVQADGESMRSAILNLVLNSFEAMPEGGTLTIVLGFEDGELRLEVADTGRGIPQEDQERVFDFAYTTRDGGNGLGLAMVHHCVVEEHGGRVSLDSRPGEGTRVRLALPVGPVGAIPEEEQ